MTGLTKSFLWVLITIVHQTNPTHLSLYVSNVRVLGKPCPPHCNPRYCSPPGSSVHWIFQARILERVAISSHTTLVSPTLIGRFFTTESPRKPPRWTKKTWRDETLWWFVSGTMIGGRGGGRGRRPLCLFIKWKSWLNDYHLVITRSARNAAGSTTYNDYLQRPDDTQNKCWQRNSNVGLFWFAKLMTHKQ